MDIRKKKVLNLLLKNTESIGGLDVVELEIRYSTNFIEYFGLEKIPTREEYDDWLEALK